MSHEEVQRADNVLCGSVCSIKEVIYELDKRLRIERCMEKAQIVTEQIGWARLWDAALDC